MKYKFDSGKENDSLEGNKMKEQSAPNWESLNCKLFILILNFLHFYFLL